MQTDGRAIQIQLVGNARGDVILFVRHHYLESTQLLNQVRVRLDVALEVGAIVGTCKDPDRP